MSFSKGEKRIHSLDDWHRLGKPKRAYHWADGRSAKELARAWVSVRSPALPTEVDAILAAHPDFGPLTEWAAEPEARLPFDSFPGEPRNADLLLVGRDGHGPVLIAVEGKADEPFGETVADALAAALERWLDSPNSKGVARIEQLARALLPPRDGGVKVGRLRYQLLTATAGALVAAQRLGIDRTLMLVHEFVTDRTTDRRHDANAADLSRFVDRLSGQPIPKTHNGGIAGPFRVPGAPLLPTVPRLYVGKVTRDLRQSVRE